MQSHAALLALALVAACSGHQSGNDSNFLKEDDNPPEEVVKGCAHAQKKCVGCHTVERLLLMHANSPKGWERYVSRMRLMPGADIRRKEEPLIVKCMVFRDFGNQGLLELTNGPAQAPQEAPREEPPAEELSPADAGREGEGQEEQGGETAPKDPTNEPTEESATEEPVEEPAP